MGEDGGQDAELLGDAASSTQPSPDGALGNVGPLGDRAMACPSRARRGAFTAFLDTQGQLRSGSSSVADLAEAAVRVTEEFAAPMFARFTGFVGAGRKLAQTRPAI